MIKSAEQIEKYVQPALNNLINILNEYYTLWKNENVDEGEIFSLIMCVSCNLMTNIICFNFDDYTIQLETADTFHTELKKYLKVFNNKGMEH